MNKNLRRLVFLGVALFFLQNISAQNDSLSQSKTYRVGIFAPLYLDSAFNDEGQFVFKQGIPRFMTPGVDFINGVQLALDSIKLNNQQVEAYIYDTKSYNLPVDKLIKYKKIENLDLIIGSVKDLEYLQLAEFALNRNIPFISATYPNDGGITGNPFLVILNSTLKAHCEAIYSYLLQNHGIDNILLIRKNGSQEDRVVSYFSALNEPDKLPLLHIQTINIDNSFSSLALEKKLDSNRQTVIIGASLDESFANTLVSACIPLHETYPILLIGMPNWDGFRVFGKKDTPEDFPVYFTSPYYNNKWDDYSKALTAGYAKKYKGKPSDMVFKGFETTYLFIKLLTTYPNDMLNHINNKAFRLYTDFNFQPVKSIPQQKVAPDYFENKHLYFIRMLNGTITKAW